MIMKNSSFPLNFMFICLSVLLLTSFHIALGGVLVENLLWSESSSKIFSIQNFFSSGLPLPQSFLSTLLLDFHNILVMSILAGIMTSVSLLTISIFFIKETNKVLNQNIKMEVLWILIPMGILLSIGIPSINMLYQLEETFNMSQFIVKVTGYQWYWTYEQAIPPQIFLLSPSMNGSNISSETFESYLLMGDGSNWEVDGLVNLGATLEVKCPTLESSRFIVSASDVMHSWALPSMFLKVDAIPGRLNQIETIFPPTLGSIYGQCSELCGVNHSFMPIVIDLMFI